MTITFSDATRLEPEVRAVLKQQGWAPEPTLHYPHRIFSIDVPPVLGSRAIFASARFVGWRFLVAHQPFAIAADTNGSLHADGVRLTTGPAIDRMSKRIERLLEHHDDASHEIRCLIVAGLHVTALWLATDRSRHDRFYVTAPAWRTFRSGSYYTAATFSTKLTAAFQKHLGDQKPLRHNRVRKARCD